MHRVLQAERLDAFGEPLDRSGPSPTRTSADTVIRRRHDPQRVDQVGVPLLGAQPADADDDRWRAAGR